ncbi:unnamed protein product, partial [Protopolystoma xenopodis]
PTAVTASSWRLRRWENPPGSTIVPSSAVSTSGGAPLGRFVTRSMNNTVADTSAGGNGPSNPGIGQLSAPRPHRSTRDRVPTGRVNPADLAEAASYLQQANPAQTATGTIPTTTTEGPSLSNNPTSNNVTSTTATTPTAAVIQRPTSRFLLASSISAGSTGLLNNGNASVSTPIMSTSFSSSCNSSHQPSRYTDPGASSMASANVSLAGRYSSREA